MFFLLTLVSFKPVRLSLSVKHKIYLSIQWKSMVTKRKSFVPNTLQDVFLCRRKSYMFGTAWRGVNNNHRIKIFGWTMPLTSSLRGPFTSKPCCVFISRRSSSDILVLELLSAAYDIRATVDSVSSLVVLHWLALSAAGSVQRLFGAPTPKNNDIWAGKCSL